MWQNYLFLTKRLLLLQLSNIAHLTREVCNVHTSKIRIIYYINKITVTMT